MSADAAQINCPICNHHGVFKNTEDLRNRLITVSTSAIKCPVCQEEIIGLDKLTIHLFSHVHMYKTENNINFGPINVEKTHTTKSQIKSNTSASKNKVSAPVRAPVKYVKIYPKLPVVSVNTLKSMEVPSTTKNDPTNIENQIFVPDIKTESLQYRSATLCNICGLQFVDKNILKMHRCLIHNIEESKEDSNVNRYQCHICPKNFKMRGSLMVHMRVAHYGFPQSHIISSIKNMTTDGTQSDPNDKNTIIKPDNKQWQCDVCHKYFTTKYFLKKHKRLHTGETPYSCAQCNKTFTFQQSYHKHLLYHNDEKPHVCNFCGRAFKELSTLHNHQRIHTGEKPFSCEACGKSFRQRVSYLVHKRIHTGVMPYKCTACDKSFRYKVSQRTHKCPAQPPGTVIRQTGDLVEKLKQKQSITVSKSEITEDKNDIYDNANQLDARDLIADGAQLSLENTETENLSLIADAFKQQESHLDIAESNIENLNLEELIDSLPASEKNVPSPSEILRNLCLSQDEESVCSPINKEHGHNRDFFTYL